VTHPIGSVWSGGDNDLVLYVVSEPNVFGRMTTIVLDNGVWPTAPGRLYVVHTKSLHSYYERIA
jgi:hypothetical protein